MKQLTSTWKKIEHSSKIKGSCLMKCPIALEIHMGNIQTTVAQNQFWCVWLGHCIKHKSLISEEWELHFIRAYSRYLDLFFSLPKNALGIGTFSTWQWHQKLWMNHIFRISFKENILKIVFIRSSVRFKIIFYSNTYTWVFLLQKYCKF